MCQSWLLVCLLGMTTLLPFASCTGCYSSLGMEDGRIKDSQITVSSAIRNATGEQARLRKNIPPWGAWCPEVYGGLTNITNFDQYIQIDLLHPTNITGIATQGREYNEGAEFVSAYKISYSRNGRTWIYYERTDQLNEAKIFWGNFNPFSRAKNSIEPSFKARYIRVQPGYNQGKHVCMRLEVHGCQLEENEKVILSYSMPAVGQHTLNGRTRYDDTSYNGVVSNGTYEGGTGILTDGKFGPVNAKELWGRGWVGWVSTRIQSKYIAITFEFSDMRKFRDVTLTVSIDRRRRHVAFNKSQIFFASSKDGFSNSSFLQYCLKDVSVTDYPHNANISFPLCENTATFIKMQLYFGGRWLLITEITFNSVPTKDEKLSFQKCSSGVTSSRVRECPISEFKSEANTTPKYKSEANSTQKCETEVKIVVKTKTSILTILVGVGISLAIALIILQFGIVNCKQRQRALKLMTYGGTPVDAVKIQNEVVAEPLDSNQESDHNEPDLASDPAAPYEEVHIYAKLDKKKQDERETNYQSLLNVKRDPAHVIPAAAQHEEAQMSSHPDYTELDKNRPDGSETKYTYQQLLKADSGFVAPAYGNIVSDSYQDMQMVKLKTTSLKRTTRSVDRKIFKSE